jgi:hypothetical protein
MTRASSIAPGLGHPEVDVIEIESNQVQAATECIRIVQTFRSGGAVWIMNWANRGLQSS